MSTFYTDDHEWVRVTGDHAVVGITRHAADQLGDVVFVELRAAGERFAKSDEIGVIESVKAASPIYAPVAGEVIQTNQAVVDVTSILNDDPEATGWLYKIKLADVAELDGLMDADAYAALIA
ncbi:glycine cleavage system protein GcvH [Aminobacter anthyllidis]|uniref:Glycine cleavage system H protein n=1 Tax=Aminobacter anthyllidis TaxID=1035067 RepID=A0A9X1AC84_9HYPH|nr:glycine cleavage system protein GcvH [Aminobacter anthyllidis]MBT1157175.1 glycine cleavage system protein GcvH [Aminobacter anthyllidis]